ncbi:MAG: tetratricopeptide repeat protein [Pyrinomonadaceae bacterium]|nr:tetratricopeptide repeat protein [Pyrinomonadaceae bacterium]
MLKRTLIVVSVTIALLLPMQLQPVYGDLVSVTELAILDAKDASATESKSEATGKRGGNSFVRALKAPFKALGRLFGGGNRKENKLERISEKDIANFESTPADPIKTTTARKAKSREKVSDNLMKVATDHLAHGRLLLNSGSLNEAIGELSVAASTDPTSGEAHNLLGLAFEQKGLRERALKSFEIAVRLNRDEPEFLNNLGYVLFKNGDYEGASKYLKRAARRAPGNARIWNNLGLAQSERGHFDDAFKSFTRAVGEFRGHLNVAMRLKAVGETKDAIKHMEKAHALRPNSTEVLARLILLYESAGKESEAQSARSTLVALRTLAEATSN